MLNHFLLFDYNYFNVEKFSRKYFYIFEMNQRIHYLYIQLLLLAFFDLYNFQLTIQNVDIIYNNTGTISNFILRLPIKNIPDPKNVWLGFGFNSQKMMVNYFHIL